jgi:hypothetical protein
VNSGRTRPISLVIKAEVVEIDNLILFCLYLTHIRRLTLLTTYDFAKSV